jgi:hypothetical protein
VTITLLSIPEDGHLASLRAWNPPPWFGSCNRIKTTNYESPHYAVFSLLLILPASAFGRCSVWENYLFASSVCAPCFEIRICLPKEQKTWLALSRHAERDGFMSSKLSCFHRIAFHTLTAAWNVHLFPMTLGSSDACLIFCFTNEWLTDPVAITTACGPHIFVSPVLAAFFLLYTRFL